MITIEASLGFSNVVKSTTEGDKPGSYATVLIKPIPSKIARENF